MNGVSLTTPDCLELIDAVVGSTDINSVVLRCVVKQNQIASGVDMAKVLEALQKLDDARLLAGLAACTFDLSGL